MALKKKLMIVLIASLTVTQAAFTVADEVVGHSPDNTAGHMLGGWAAFLAGGAAGGPVGAITAGLAGAWLGGNIQQASGQSGSLHHIRTDAGGVEILRSPNHFFAIGESVTIAGGRPRALDE